VQIMAYARRIPALERDAYVAEVRREGYLDFELKPAGERDEYSSVHFLEPFSDRSMRIFGYDMLTDPVRRLAMERARDSAEPIFSGRTPLLQNVDGKPNEDLLSLPFRACGPFFCHRSRRNRGAYIYCRFLDCQA
jgi:CHASE1-domain containing sensor protein